MDIEGEIKVEYDERKEGEEKRAFKLQDYILQRYPEIKISVKKKNFNPNNPY